MEQRSAIRSIADGLLIVGGVGIIFKILIWVLNFYGLAQAAGKLVQNRSLLRQMGGFVFEYWPLWVFALGIFLLACIQYGPPKYWIEKMRATKGAPGQSRPEGP
jgi:hypothetical protein